MNLTVFICKRKSSPEKDVRVQLQIPRRALENFKYQSAATGKTTKQVMETILENWESIESDFKKAIKYLKVGKDKFTPGTTNSYVDELINKYEGIL